MVICNLSGIFRFKVQKSGQFIQNVGENTLQVHKSFFLVFVYFNEDTLEIDKIWIVPSTDFVRVAYKKKKGTTYKSFYRFSANPRSKIDRWSKYSVDKTNLGDQLIQLMHEIYPYNGI